MLISSKICRTLALVAAAYSVRTPRNLGVVVVGAFSSPSPSSKAFHYPNSRRLTVNANRLQDAATLQNHYYALRHGQSEANVAGIIASDPEIARHKFGLSPLGKEQAQKAGHDVLHNYRLQAINGDAFKGICLISSDLLRAKETAEAVERAIRADEQYGGSEPILLHRGHVILETRLRERFFGEWDLTSDTNYNNVWKDDAVDPCHETNGVESVTFVMDRVTECVVDWDSQLKNHMIICVAHGDVLQILQTCFSKLDGSQHRTLDHLETATLRKLELTGSST
jgi:probable phosphoglycerate mutase